MRDAAERRQPLRLQQLMATHDEAVAKATELRDAAREAVRTAHTAYTAALRTLDSAVTEPAYRALLAANDVLRLAEKALIAEIVTR